MNIVIVRMKASLNYKLDPRKPDSWENNRANNSLDQFWLFNDHSTLFACKVQTFTNLPGCRPQDSIQPGSFKLRLFQDQRDFWCPVHGIIDTYDGDGQYINESSVVTILGKDGAPTSFDRYLMHDWQKHKHNPDGTLNAQGIDTSVAWSLGCFIPSTVEHARFNALLMTLGLKKDDVISGELRMQVV